MSITSAPLTDSTTVAAVAEQPVTVQLAIRADASEVWRALIDGAITPAYYYGFAAEFPAEAGRPYRYTAGGSAMITGEVIELERERFLSMTFAGHWQPDVAALPASEVRISLAAPAMPLPGVTVLTLEHLGLAPRETARDLHHGWAMILSGLKTLLETGSPLATPVEH